MNWRFFIKPKNLAIILAVILPLIALYFDLRVYKNYVSSLGAKKEESNGEFLLNTPLLQKIANELEVKKKFLQNPKYPLIKEPF